MCTRFYFKFNLLFFFPSLGPSWQSPASSQNQHSYSWYLNASDSDKKPLAQTATLKTGSQAESAYDSWDAIMGLRPPSPNQEPRNPAPTLSWGLAGAGTAPGGLHAAQTTHRKPLSPQRLQSPTERNDVIGRSDLAEMSKLSQTSASLSIERNSNCRTYRRPNKQGCGKASDSSGFDDAAFGTDLPKSSTGADDAKATGGVGGRGRTRDYTVLQPSSTSMCNVTNQDRGRDEFNSEAAPASGASGAASGSTTELGEQGWQRKKIDMQQTR